jgi:hypothetical protein
MKENFFDVTGHMKETGQINDPEKIKLPENLEGDLLEKIDATIDEVLKKSRITMNTQDVRVVPKLSEDLKKLVRDSKDWQDFNRRWSSYTGGISLGNETHDRYATRLIDDLFGQDVAGKIIHTYLKEKTKG